MFEWITAEKDDFLVVARCEYCSLKAEIWCFPGKDADQYAWTYEQRGKPVPQKTYGYTIRFAGEMLTSSDSDPHHWGGLSSAKMCAESRMRKMAPDEGQVISEAIDRFPAAMGRSLRYALVQANTDERLIREQKDRAYEKAMKEVDPRRGYY